MIKIRILFSLNNFSVSLFIFLLYLWIFPWSPFFLSSIQMRCNWKDVCIFMYSHIMYLYLLKYTKNGKFIFKYRIDYYSMEKWLSLITSLTLMKWFWWIFFTFLLLFFSYSFSFPHFHYISFIIISQIHMCLGGWKVNSTLWLTRMCGCLWKENYWAKYIVISEYNTQFVIYILI